MRGLHRTLRPGLLLLLGAALAGCPKAPPPPPPAPPAAALVDGAAVPLALVQRELQRLRRQGSTEPAGGEVPRAVYAAQAAPDGGEPAPLPVEPAALLGPLIDQKLLAARAQALGIQISDADVQRATDALAEAAQAAGQSFSERLAQDGLTEEQLREETRERLLAERAMARELREQGLSAPTAQELKAFADAHRAELDLPEQVRVLHLMCSAPELAKSLLDRLRKGAPFSELAREYGETPDARSGGDLGFFARGTMPAIFDEVAFGLRPGELSGVVRSAYGYHLFKLVDRRPARHRTAEEARPELERRLFAEKRTAAERTVLEQLRKKAHITVDEAALATLK